MPGHEQPEILSSPADDLGRIGRFLVSARGRWWATVVAVGLAGVLVGALGAHYAAQPSPPPPTTAAAAATSVDIRVSLGAGAGGPPTVVQGRAVVEVPVVLTNEASTTVGLASIRVSGPGAALTTDPTGRPSPDLPLRLAPGQSFDVRFGLSSDCSVSVRPLPQVTLVVLDAHDQTQDVPVAIPDLDGIWGQTLLPGACR
ncbi:MAG TPA: hypothetical protein VIM19_09965 [Actinomycetes bacterium]